MRLSNRTKTWAEAGRRLWGERKDQRDGGDEANSIAAWDAAFGSPAPAVSSASRESVAPPAPDTAPMTSTISGDPTQQLLTALGRFQRQVNLADTGAPPEAWVDNCIDQLIAGIQIAHVRGWKGVKEALTDTARILQSYDEGGDAAGCVAFLHDGYEILCLMVGDLIVDNVRSGVMDKWRERYNRAVSDLHHAGFSLIDDDSTGAQQHQPQRPAPSPAAEAARPTNVTPFVPRAAAIETPADEAPQALNARYFEEEAEEESHETDEPDVTYVEADSEEAGDDDYTSPFVYAEDDGEELVEDSPQETVEEVVVGTWDGMDEEEESEEAEEPSALLMDSEEEDIEDETADAEMEASPFDEPIVLEEEEEVALAVVELEEDEVEDEEEPLTEAYSTPALMEEEEPEADAIDLLEEAEDEDDEEEEDNLDLFAEAERAQETLLLFEEAPGTDIEEAAAEEEELIAEATLAEEEAEEDEAEEVQPEAPAAVDAEETHAARQPEETPEAILRHAQAAMLRGDVRDAKVLALQLAVNMAKLEAQKAVQIVQDAVDKLVSTESAIEVADADVAKAQQRLEQMHHARSTREHDLDIKRAGIAGLEKRGSNVEAAIAKLDEQIARLQLQRETELARLQEVQAELEAERDDERIVAEDLDRLHEAEQAAQDTLELAHTRLAELQEQRLEREQAREACEQMLARQRESAETITATLDAVLGGKSN